MTQLFDRASLNRNEKKACFVAGIYDYDCNAGKKEQHRAMMYNGSSSCIATRYSSLSAVRETAKNSSRVRAILDKRKALL